MELIDLIKLAFQKSNLCDLKDIKYECENKEGRKISDELGIFPGSLNRGQIAWI